MDGELGGGGNATTTIAPPAVARPAGLVSCIA
eukprot:COSAG01_NODE_52001_length_350_cov_0.609562_1_plen_31_part_01